MSSDKGESDVAADPQVATSRATGGADTGGDALDEASTTGTSESGEYVGLVEGHGGGYAGETGAERRSNVRRGV